MKFVAVIIAAVAFVACGAESDGQGPTTAWDQCDHEGERCIREGYGGPRQGTCRAYEGASPAYWCCSGCWDLEYSFCHTGKDAPMCGALGEDCSASKCAGL